MVVDYVGWELERQRSALKALALGGAAESGEDIRAGDGGREKPAPFDRGRSLAKAGFSRSTGARALWRFAKATGDFENPPGEPLEDRETVREAGRNRLTWRDRGPRTPPSAWEAALGETAGTFASEGWSAETGALPIFPQGEDSSSLSREGTGPRTTLRGGRNRPESGEKSREAAEKRAEPKNTAARFARERRPGEAPPPKGRDGGGENGGALINGGGVWTAPSAKGRLTGAGEGEGTSALFQSGVWKSAAPRAEAGARVLSRAFQRDARRYDGGFTIY